MPDNEHIKAAIDSAPSPFTAGGPLVFVSHDGRDAELAEAFSKLLRSVSAGMIKTFRSSDKKGSEGIPFGDEWFKRVMAALQTTSDMVCLFTERSLERPWILFEAGIAKGKLTTPVIGLALGVPLDRVSTGPFYQFMNMAATEDELTKLIRQLAKRVPGVELDDDVVKTQVGIFKAAEQSILKAAATAGTKKPSADEADGSPIAKLIEEMKSLPSRVAERMIEDGSPSRRRKMRGFHPMMLEELLHLPIDPGDPVVILMAASMVREDAPWLYVLAMEVYRAAKLGDPEVIGREIQRLRQFSEVWMHGPWMREFGDRDSHMLAMEFPRMMERMLNRAIEMKKPASPPPRLKRRAPIATKPTE